MSGSLHILKPGLLTTIQDLGRWGYQTSGVPAAGPMDLFSHRLANHLVGNNPAAATLEITLIGPDIEVDAETRIAVTGAVFDVTCDDRNMPLGASMTVRRGQRIKFGRLHQGARSRRPRARGRRSHPD